MNSLSIDSLVSFYPGNIPVKVAARMMGKNVNFVREGIEKGWLPIGYYVKNGTRSDFYISPKQFYEVTGQIWRGEAE